MDDGSLDSRHQRYTATEIGVDQVPQLIAKALDAVKKIWVEELADDAFKQRSAGNSQAWFFAWLC